jgi:Mg2+ and Co2+ transporter CorA
MQPGGQPPYPQQYPPGNSQVVLREVGQQKENRMAIAALVLGIVTLIFFWAPPISLITGIIGMVMAIISLVKEDSKAMPIIGMILSIIGLALASLMILGYIVEYLTYMY